MNDGDSLFQPVGTRRVSDEAVRQILALTESGRLKPGDRLPGERDLTRQLSISRSAVREAIRLLEAQGVLEVLPGKGTFVTDLTRISGLPARWSHWLLENGDKVLDLLEVRGSLEPLAATLAAEKATSDAVGALWDTLDQIDSYLDEGKAEGAAQGDIRFHQLISLSSGNEFLIELNEGINLSLIEHRIAYYSIPGKAAESNHQHREIVQAIEEGDPPRAASVMSTHISSSREYTRILLDRLNAGQEGGN